MVHSVDGIGLRYIKRGGTDTHDLCFVVGNNAAYKNTQAGILTYEDAKRIEVEDVVLIDNAWSLITQIGRDQNHLRINYYRISVYGETQDNECPYEDYCLDYPEDAICLDKYGLMVPYFSEESLGKFTGKVPYKIESDAAFAGKSHMK